jgi:holo-[acyl-carrier protein] synthase
MILGVGIDLVETERIKASVDRFGDRFLARILRPGEQDYCRKFRDSETHIAARFAAKEAISKAFGTGIGKELGWLDMEIVNQPGGRPVAILHDRGLELLAARGARALLVSLSHTRNHATAIALLSDEQVPDPV